LKQSWCIPPKAHAEFVCQMEEVLEVYQRPYDPKHPLVCMDETSKQLVSETRPPRLAQPGQPARYDYEYQREGVCNLFMFFEPLRGRRQVVVSERRTRQDWALVMRELVDVRYPEAELWCWTNLNTHTGAALYEAFVPAEARRILRHLQFHYTPKHGSWLNMAEIELSVLTRQCLDRRIGDRSTLQQEVAAWEVERNRKGATVDWQFTTADARIQLKSLYPVIHG
jgi:uncharacterized small protein (DUF1192 family)